MQGGENLDESHANRVTEVCEREFERLARAALEDRRLSKYQAQIPVIGGPYRQENHAGLTWKIARALAAQRWHAETTPLSWANPLPLRDALKLLGYFARSMRWNDWDQRHPPFHTFCSGALDYIFGPMEMRTDPELLKMFPPKPLAGFTTSLQWRSPER